MPPPKPLDHEPTKNLTIQTPLLLSHLRSNFKIKFVTKQEMRKIKIIETQRAFHV